MLRQANQTFKMFFCEWELEPLTSFLQTYMEAWEMLRRGVLVKTQRGNQGLCSCTGSPRECR